MNIQSAFWLDQPIRPVLSRLVALKGENFSGRSDILKWLTFMEADWTIESDAMDRNERPSAYVGPEVYNAISGLATTVYGELCLHAGGAPEHSDIAPLASDLRLPALFARNPFTLSGGEQVILTVTSALALRPAVLGIDCALEQLDSMFKARLLDWLRHDTRHDTATVIADNRLDECGSFSETLSAAAFERPVTTRRLHLETPRTTTTTLPVAPPRSCRITLDTLGFGYKRGSAVLRDVSVDLTPGLYFLEGPNGSGKSTLAKLLSGVLKPTSGSILVDNEQYHPSKYPGQLVAYHFQNPDLQLFSTTVEEELKSGPRARGLRERQCTERAMAILDFFGLGATLREHPLDLPFVLRKRVALAATIAMACPWVILDEPTLGQDINASEAIVNLIQMLRDLGIGVVIISHWSSLRQRLGGTHLELASGRLIVDRGVGTNGV